MIGPGIKKVPCAANIKQYERSIKLSGFGNEIFAREIIF